jgi:proline iminopeptidase
MTTPESVDADGGRGCQFRVSGTGARLVVRDTGGAGPVVLLLHGGPGCPDYLAPVAAMLPPGVRAVTFDQRGVGGSTCAGDYRVEDYVADIDTVRAHLGVDQVHLLGHSWGGLLAQLYLARHPDRVASLCLLNSAAGVGRQWTQTEREVLAHNRRRAGLRGFAALGVWAAATCLPGPAGDHAARQVFARVWRNYFPRGETPPAADPSWLRGVNRVAARRTAKSIKAMPASSLDGLGSDRLPVLSLYGDGDIYGPSTEHLTTRFPTGRHIVLPGCGHLPWLQAPQAFQHSITQFYDGAVQREARVSLEPAGEAAS